MKLILAFVFVIAAIGCTTLEPIEMPPEELQEYISEGDLIEPGDVVKVVTSDGERHKFKVTATTADRITGKSKEVLISDIVAIETREFSGGKTALLAAGAASFVYGTLLLAGIAGLFGL